MRLSEQLAAFKAEFARTAMPGRVALYDAKLEELHAVFAQRNLLKVGDVAPDFTLPNAQRKSVVLSSLLRDGPVVLIFYRGGWCPYCNLQLRAYQGFLPDIQALDGQLVAVSPQLPHDSLSTAEANALSFDVLSDVGNHVAQSYGLAYVLSKELQDALRSVNKALPDINGDESWRLPVPATFVIASRRRIVAAEINVDYRKRPDPEEILGVLKQVASAS